MKKLLIALFAFVSLISCSKQDIMYDDFQQEIGFSAVASHSTKSVAGYNDNGVFDGIFPTGVKLYVFANVQDENDGVLQNSWNTPYFKNAEFVWTTAKNESTIDDYAKGGSYAGNPTRYWPNVKSLKFAGYSDACGVDKTTPTMDFENNILTIPSYTQNNSTNYSAEGANDLMWFPCDGNVYTKQANEVVANMLHACSWITINIYGDDVTSTYSTGEGESTVTHTGWTLNSLLVKGLYHTGKAECVGVNKSVNWTFAKDAVKADEYYLGSEGNDVTETFDTTPTEYANTDMNFIVLPQTPTTLDVKYTYTSQEAVGDQSAITLTETKNISLAIDNANTPWQSGYHYIYNVKITATEILIDPVVKDWTSKTVNLPHSN